MSREFRDLLCKAVSYRGHRISRAQRRDAAEGGAYYSAFRPKPGERVSRRKLTHSFVDGRRRVVDVGAPASRQPGQPTIGRRLKKAGAGVNKAARQRAKALAKRRAARGDLLAIRNGALHRVAKPRPFRASLRGGNDDLLAAARMGGKRRRKPRAARS